MRYVLGLSLAILLIVMFSACGGRGVQSPTASVPPSSGGTNSGGGNGTSPVQGMRTVNVSGGNMGGIDINVATPANTAGPNAELLGTSELNSPTTATNSGATIRRGTTMKVVLFGRALSGGLTVTIGGPADVTVSNIRGVSATDGTAGIAFDATVSSGAALGARTVYLRSSNDDITAFTGGLEIVP